MKKLLVIAALTVAAAPAMASKARITALGNADHLIDTQSVFENTADIHYLGDYATIEFGGTAANATTNGTAPRAEGGFVRSSSMGKWGAYLGRQSATVNEFVTIANLGAAAGTTVLTEQNALDLFFGMDSGIKWGIGAHYSATKLETTTQEVNTLGISGGVRTDLWDAYARVGLGGETKNTGATPRELKQKGLYDVGYGMWFDTLYVSAKYLMTAGDLTTGGTTTEIQKNQYSVNVIDNVKVEGGNFFYGASYVGNEVKGVNLATGAVSGNNKTTESSLPLVVGMELDAASWLILRGSVTQNVFLGERKFEGATSVTNKMVNNTVVAAGVGVKFAKLTLDATLAGATNGNAAATGTSNGSGDIDGDQLLANGSLTYMF